LFTIQLGTDISIRGCFKLLLYSSSDLDFFFLVTGLDPAGPLFTNVLNPRFRLDPGDAGYVDVIHTDMPRNLFGIGLGMRKEAGHADFFVNGGVSQPGCENSSRLKHIRVH